jgi:precorrin-8X/cobalt-precorrin-8 methylmutase
VTEFLRDPAEIYRRSFEIITAETDFSHLPAHSTSVAKRIIHACGMPDIVQDLRISTEFYSVATEAINQRRPILVDAEMIRHGIIGDKSQIICTLNEPDTSAIAARIGSTRSAAAVTLWHPHLAGAVAVVGNAPTALFTLLELIDHGAPKPAAIIGLPVGFVGAAESKAELHTNPRGIAYLTLLGRRGGSAMAAAAVNALLRGLE